MNPEVAKALLAVQKEAPKIQSDGINPHFGSRYVTLESLMETILPVLNRHGVVLIQSPTSDGSLFTRLIHAETGEDVVSTIPLMLSKDDAQGQGSAITYARRYALMAMLGLVADEDDDGNQASVAHAEDRQRADEGAVRREFDPGKDLLPGAIAVKSRDDAVAVRQAQRDLSPDENWVAVEEFLAASLWGKALDELNRVQTGEWWKRLANAVTKANDLAGPGDFPPPSIEQVKEAYAWAFKGAVLALSAPQMPPEASAGAEQPVAAEEPS
jgi:hypothetical protein